MRKGKLSMDKTHNRNEATQKHNAKVMMYTELNNFFDGSTSSKIKTLNNVLNSFLNNEGLKNHMTDPNYVSNTVFHITSVIDHLAASAENWERFKKTHPELIKNL